ncbi:MAG: DUF4157 domain-containing protein [Campylobacterales bacterium]|nr:DUF4157 domain-containing protein [Campylobacterales bacterium]
MGKVSQEMVNQSIVQKKSSPKSTPSSQKMMQTPLMQQKAKEHQSIFGTASVLQRQANSTGLPDNLKAGIENLSGYSMNDVKVHYNSPKPAQLNAHAYAQGSDIHIASGQEKHLPHEAWHVVQQKQGRVKPTVQMKGKVNINDDQRLEKEADTMGKKALQMKSVATPNNFNTPFASTTIQKTSIDANEFKKLVVTGLRPNKENAQAVASISQENELLNNYKKLKIDNIQEMQDAQKKALEVRQKIGVAKVKVIKAKNKEISKTKKTPFYNAMIGDLQGDSVALNKTLGLYDSLIKFKEMQLLQNKDSRNSDEQNKLDSLKEAFGQTKESELKKTIEEFGKKETLTPDEETQLAIAKNQLALIEHQKNEEEIKTLEGQQKPLSREDQEKLNTKKEQFAQNETKLNATLQEQLGKTFDELKIKVSYDFEKVGFKAALQKTASYKLILSQLAMIGGFIKVLFALAFKPLGWMIGGIVQLIKGFILFAQDARGVGEDGFSDELKTGITLLDTIIADDLTKPLETIKKVGNAFSYLGGLFETRKDAQARGELVEKFKELAAKMSTPDKTDPTAQTPQTPQTQTPQTPQNEDPNTIISYVGIPSHIKKALKEEEKRKLKGDDNSIAVYELFEKIEANALKELEQKEVYEKAEKKFEEIREGGGNSSEKIEKSKHYYEEAQKDYTPKGKIVKLYHNASEAYYDVMSNKMAKDLQIKIPTQGVTLPKREIFKTALKTFKKLETNGVNKEASQKLIEKMIEALNKKKPPYLVEMIEIIAKEAHKEAYSLD